MATKDSTFDAVAIVSGGMDSTTLAYSFVKDFGYSLHMVSFNYGQRHKKELDFAAITAKKLKAKHSIIDLSSVGKLLKGSALTDDIAVPEGHYAEENMAVTVVPNRNAIMLSIAWGIAISDGARVVGTAIHAGDHAIYPDCRPEFVVQLNTTLRIANEGFGDENLMIMTPYVNISKAEIATRGANIGVPFEDTWSCYKGNKLHCGKCGTCVERIEAFKMANVEDPTEYAPGGMKYYEQLAAEGKVFAGHHR
jgi:7-cyano-7-deazaguanine synthase